eukprot:SAG31_NODE_1105_length_9882_cov_5.270571_6_plen_65_part_00
MKLCDAKRCSISSFLRLIHTKTSSTHFHAHFYRNIVVTPTHSHRKFLLGSTALSMLLSIMRASS